MGRIAIILFGLSSTLFCGLGWAENQPTNCTKDEVNLWLVANEKNIVRPIYPPQARREGRQGSVLLSLSVDENGSVQNIVLKRSSGYADLDNAASNAYKVAKFTSPLCGGKPSPITTMVPIRFQLSEGDVPLSNTSSPMSVEERKNIEELLAVTGALKLGKSLSDTFVKQMTASLKQQHPELPSNMFDALADEVSKTIDESMNSRNGLAEIIIAIYHKYYSNEEIQALLAFYQTPVGKKSIAILPAITQESMALGMLWGRGLAPVIGQRVKERFKKNGYEI